MDGAKLCRDLRQRNRFQDCRYDLRPYNASVYLEASRGLEPDGALVNRLGLYPMRIVSLFSTLKRCLDLVELTEANANSADPKAATMDLVSAQDGTRATAFRYDMIFVTRLDVINCVKFNGKNTHRTVRRTRARLN